MNEKELMEALPIMAKLSKKYTSGESSSVTYETANQLMGTIFYCVHEYETGSALPKRQVEVSLREKYEIGRSRLIQKIQDCQMRYSDLMTYFKAYGNHNYEDTVTKAISGFFVSYDFMFYPQNTIITCDYPTIIPVCGMPETGIDLIEKYLTYIELEQKFLHKLEDEFIYDILYRSNCDYRNQYDNISAIIFRSLLGLMLTGENIKEKREHTYNRLFDMIQKNNLTELKNRLDQSSMLMFHKKYENAVELHEYFKNEVTELAVRLKQVKDANSLQNILVLLP